MAKRTRILTFGLAGFVVLVGVLCAVFVNGKTGTVASATLITLGCGFAVLLVFFEVGLSEDHAREREEQERRASTRRDPEIRKLPWSQRRP
jgi:hypothetical protein